MGSRFSVMRSALLIVGVSGGAALFAACSASDHNAGVFTSAGGPGGGDNSVVGTGVGGRNGGEGGGDIGFDGGLSGSVGTTMGSDCVAGQDEDHDMDGFSIAQGDCNDCDGNVN